MLKKFFAVLSVALLTQCAWASNEYSDAFMNSLIYCRPYREVSTALGFTIVDEVRGWYNNKCVYQKYPKEQTEYRTTCLFSPQQLNKLKQAQLMQKNNSKMTTKTNIEGYNVEVTSDPYTALFTTFFNDGTCRLPKVD